MGQVSNPQVGESVVYYDAWGKPMKGVVVAVRATKTLDLSIGTPTHPQIVQNVSRAERKGHETTWDEFDAKAEAFFADPPDPTPPDASPSKLSTPPSDTKKGK